MIRNAFRVNLFTFSALIALILCFPGLLAEFSPLQAVTEARVPLATREIALDQANLPGEWAKLSAADRRVLAVHLIEVGSRGAVPARRKAGYQALLNQSSQDPFLNAAAQIMTVYFSQPAAGQRARSLQRLQTQKSASATLRSLATFFAALNRLQQTGTSAQVSAVQSDVSAVAQGLQAICRFPEQRQICQLVRLRASLGAAAKWSAHRPAGVYEIMRIGRPLLGRSPWRPPFYVALGAGLPERLYAIGLPLEGAILAERMTSAQRKQPTARERQIRGRIPYYLASAADFDSALRFADRISGDGVLTNARLDWMILAGRYNEALNYITKTGAARLTNRNYAGDRDYWSGFSTSRQELQLRSAMLLYLAGDVKKAAAALERLTDMRGRTSTNEPAGQYARLRLAQILLRENPKLAHKLAEDVTYIAQANEWHVLEYRATVIDGWAYIYMNQPYRGVINFIKARGILPAHLKQHGAEYTRLLGLLTARNRMNPRGNYSALIKQINTLLQRRPYNAAVFTLREWAHREAGPSAFLLEAVRNLNLRGRRWDALNLLIEYSYTDQRFFSAGENPGGQRGFLTSAMWSQELNRFAYIKRSPLSGLQLAPVARKGAQALLPRTGDKNLQPTKLNKKNYYVFSFRVQGGRYVYMAYPGKRSPGIDYIFLKTPVLHKIKQACRFQNGPAGIADCKAFSSEFDSLRKRVGRTKGSQLYVYFDPEFDPDYRALIFNASGPDSVVHFSQPKILPAKGAAAAGHLSASRVLRSRACSAALDVPGALAVSDLDARFTEGRAMGGIWLWPRGLDSRLTSSGNVRPVYLRKFICGSSRLRLWDMDRFGQPRSGVNPDLIVYRRRKGDASLDQAFARYFADRGAALLEVSGSAGGLSGGRAVLQSIQSQGQKQSNVQSHYRRGVQKGGSGALRLILPGIPG